MEKTIRFQGMDSLQHFAAVVGGFPEKMEIRSEDTTINAKSMMGLFSLNLSKPVKLYFEADRKRSREICDAVSAWLVE